MTRRDVCEHGLHAVLAGALETDEKWSPPVKRVDKLEEIIVKYQRRAATRRVELDADGIGLTVHGDKFPGALDNPRCGERLPPELVVYLVRRS